MPAKAEHVSWARSSGACRASVQPESRVHKAWLDRRKLMCPWVPSGKSWDDPGFQRQKTAEQSDFQRQGKMKVWTKPERLLNSHVRKLRVVMETRECEGTFCQSRAEELKAQGLGLCRGFSRKVQRHKLKAFFGDGGCLPLLAGVHEPGYDSHLP